MEAAARESRANAQEDAVTLTSGAKEKVDRTVASVQGLAEKITHPMDADARKRIDEKTDLRKAEASAKQAAIRQMAHQEAEKERSVARSQVAQIYYQGQGGNRYAQLPAAAQIPPPPLPLPAAAQIPPPLPAGADSACAPATEVLHPIESPPVHVPTAGGLSNSTNLDGNHDPLPHPHPLPLPPQSSDSPVVAATADVVVDSHPSMSANEVPAQPNTTSALTSNTGVGK